MTDVTTAPRLYLIRHGETEWSLSGQHTGRTDLPLTPNGVDEARELGRYIQELNFSQVLSSPLKRALETCALVGLDRVPEIAPDLAEWDYGDYEGRRSVDIHQERPDWNIFQDGCPQGETPAQVSARADRVMARLQKMTGHVALFSHGHFSSVLAVRWIGLNVVEGRHFSLKPTSIGVLSFDPHHAAVPTIALWNTSFHKKRNLV